jgi:hypothetical protein
MIPTTMATTTSPAARGTMLSIHDCPGCGAPIPLRQEAIGESLLKLAAATSDTLGLDIAGDCTPLYCIPCLETMLDDDARRAELAWFKDGLDALSR